MRFRTNRELPATAFYGFGVRGLLPLLLAAVVTLTACGGSSSPSSQQAQRWRATGSSRWRRRRMGTGRSDFQRRSAGRIFVGYKWFGDGQTVYSVTSSASITGPCNSGSAPVTVTVSGQNVTITDVAGSQTFTLTGTLSSDGSTMMGTYTSTAGTAPDGSPCGYAVTGTSYTGARLRCRRLPERSQGASTVRASIGAGQSRFRRVGIACPGTKHRREQRDRHRHLELYQPGHESKQLPLFLDCLGERPDQRHVCHFADHWDERSDGGSDWPTGGFADGRQSRDLEHGARWGGRSARGGAHLHGSYRRLPGHPVQCHDAGRLGKHLSGIKQHNRLPGTDYADSGGCDFSRSDAGIRPTTTQTITLTNNSGSHAERSDVAVRNVDTGCSAEIPAISTGCRILRSRIRVPLPSGQVSRSAAGGSCTITVSFAPQEGCPWLPFPYGGNPAGITGVAPEYCPFPLGATLTVVSPVERGRRNLFCPADHRPRAQRLQPSTPELDFGAEEQFSPPRRVFRKRCRSPTSARIPCRSSAARVA